MSDKLTLMAAAAVPLVASTPHEAGLALFDAHSIAHLGVGMLAGTLGWHKQWTLLGVIAYEIALAWTEHGPKQALFSPGHAESLGNQAVDVLTAMVGYAIGELVKHKRQEWAQQQVPAPASQSQPASVAGYYGW